MSTWKRRLFQTGRDGGARDLGLLVLRVGFGFSLAFAHGHGKLMRFLDGNFKFADPIGLGSAASLGLASFAEFVCAIAVIVGLATRWACVPIMILLSVAFFVVHGDDPFADKEKAFVFLTAFIAIFLAGPGRFSLDGYLGKK
ncbi:MAG: DoxX family protein [Thermoanaerobaculia bacterium]|nr:DoxX family protein [Thermoanaerobaculia bacterium]